MRIDDDFKWTYYPIIFAIVFIVFLVLNYFNLTLGLNIQDLIKIDILITLLIGQYFENREWFKTVFLIMISLALLMVFVDFLEKNLYFGLGSPNALRLIIMVGGSTAIVMANLWYLKWKMGEV